FMWEDKARDQDMIAARLLVEEIRRHIGADTLAYISLEGMMKAIGAKDGYCNACFTGDYPTGLDESFTKLEFEDAIV
ncbi:MAG: amidophosphoribosyltransferase, partial [Anaerolineae bacterium]